MRILDIAVSAFMIGLTVSVFIIAQNTGSQTSSEVQSTIPANIDNAYRDQFHIPCIIKTNGDTKALSSGGLTVYNTIGPYCTVEAPETIFQRPPISAIDGIDAPSFRELCSKYYTSSPRATIPLVDPAARKARDSFHVTGKGVIIGIIDTGLDLVLPHFCRLDATYSRVLALWDQMETHADGDDRYNVKYGHVYDSLQIHKLLSSPNPRSKIFDDFGHGTAVAGIASAGFGSDTGIAPNTELVAVRLRARDFLDVYIIDGICFIRRIAEKARKPYIINISIGGHFGSHDGQGYYERILDLLLQESDTTGMKGIVISGGNDSYNYDEAAIKDTRDHRVHVRRRGSDSFRIIKDGKAEKGGDYFDVALWFPDNATPRDSKYHTITVESPSHDSLQASNDSGVDMTTRILKDGAVAIRNGLRSSGGSESSMVLIHIKDTTQDGTKVTVTPGIWTICVKSPSTYDSTWWDAYITAPSSSDHLRTTYADSLSCCPYYCVVDGGNSNEVITVGSYNSYNDWHDQTTNPPYNPILRTHTIAERAHNSSLGPTRLNLSKPDIYAPGAWVSTPRPGIPDNLLSLSGYKFTDSCDNMGYILTSGTSFAAPYISGCLALMVEAVVDSTHPYGFLDHDSLKSILVSTSDRHDGINTVNIFNALARVNAIKSQKQ